MGVLIFLIIYSPLIFFDYFHKGSNIITPLRFKEFSSSPSVQSNPQRHFEVLYQSLGRLWYLNPHTSNADNVLYSCSPFAYLDKTSTLVDQISTRTKPFFWVSFSSLILILWFIIFSFKRHNFNLRLLSSSLLLIAISYLFLPVATHEYYLLGLYPLILFLPGILLNSINKIFRQLLLILILTCSTLAVFTILTTSDDFGLNKKQKLISKVLAVIGKDSFEIGQMGICQHYGGWRYLFSISGKFPEKSATDESLGWLYPDEITKSKVKYKVVFHEARVPVDFDTQNINTISEGGFKAYIIKNY